MRISIMVLLALGCAGCIGDYDDKNQILILQNKGFVRIEPAQNKSYDYIVRIGIWENPGIIIIDNENKQQREKTALWTIRAQCPNAKIVGEDIIEKGPAVVPLFSPPRADRDYLVQIKCR